MALVGLGLVGVPVGFWGLAAWGLYTDGSEAVDARAAGDNSLVSENKDTSLGKRPQGRASPRTVARGSTLSSVTVRFRDPPRSLVPRLPVGSALAA